jgi:hypothetical protein
MSAEKILGISDDAIVSIGDGASRLAIKKSIELLITRMQAHPEVSKEEYNRWAVENEKIDRALVDSVLKNYVSETIQDLSDNIPDTVALNNKFFDKWLSGEPLDFDTIKGFLVRYKAITDQTRHAVAIDYLTAHGDLESEVKFSANLYEENGSGKVDGAHIKLLDVFAVTLLEIVSGKKLENTDLSEKANPDLINKSTIIAKKAQQELYTGRFVDDIGITDSLLIGNHSAKVKAGIEAVAAAHEGKAAGMLSNIFEGCVKYLESASHTQKTAFRKYFDEHLGTDIVDRMLDGEKFSGKLKEENAKIKGWSSDKLRANGYVEQAHRVDANSAVINMIFSEGTTLGKVEAFIAATRGFQLFLETQGKFWNGVLDNTIEKNKIPERRIEAGFANRVGRSKSYSDYRREDDKGLILRKGESKSDGEDEGFSRKEEAKEFRKRLHTPSPEKVRTQK